MIASVESTWLLYTNLKMVFQVLYKNIMLVWGLEKLLVIVRAVSRGYSAAFQNWLAHNLRVEKKLFVWRFFPLLPPFRSRFASPSPLSCNLRSRLNFASHLLNPLLVNEWLFWQWGLFEVCNKGFKAIFCSSYKSVKFCRLTFFMWSTHGFITEY